MSLIAAEAVGKSYRSGAWLAAPEPKTVLRDVDLAIAPGECVGLLGRSGCGKSTLARLLLGLEKPDGIYWFWIGTHAEYDLPISR